MNHELYNPYCNPKLNSSIELFYPTLVWILQQRRPSQNRIISEKIRKISFCVHGILPIVPSLLTTPPTLTKMLVDIAARPRPYEPLAMR